MELTEKEIEETQREFLGKWLGMYLGRLSENDCKVLYELGKGAAHAIFKRLKEDVVWEGEGWVVHSYTNAEVPYTILELAGRPIDGIMDGQQVQVTVRKLNGDKDGNNA